MPEYVCRMCMHTFTCIYNIYIHHITHSCLFFDLDDPRIMFLWYSWFFVAVIPGYTVECQQAATTPLANPFWHLSYSSTGDPLGFLRLITLGQQPPGLEWTLWVRKITWKASRKSWWNCSLWLNWTLLTTGAGKLSVQRMWIWAGVTHFRWYKHTVDGRFGPFVPEAAQLDSAVQHQDGWFKHCNPNRLVALPDHLSQLENLRKHLVWKRLNDFRREGLTTLFGEKDLQTEKAFKHLFKQLHLN